MLAKFTGHFDIGQVILDHFLEVRNAHINAVVQDNKFYGTFNAAFADFH
jgi:pyruvate/2-oxoacid:ferredoxin oxidoreductase beta subunit